MNCTCDWQLWCDGRGNLSCWNRNQDCYCQCGCREECGGCKSCEDFDPHYDDMAEESCAVSQEEKKS